MVGGRLRVGEGGEERVVGEVGRRVVGEVMGR